MDRACAKVIGLFPDDRALVSAVALPTCEACHAKGACGESVFGGTGERTVEAWNAAGARVGDLVALEVVPRAVLASAVVLYGIPTAAVLAGAALGATVGPRLLGVGADASVGLFLGTFLVGALVCVRWLGRRLARRPSFRVRIAEVLPAAALPAGTEESSGA
ncbi:MAG: SoxR reducing system RseC family protein [Deltaproteobacteria bacterium]|nr:SoxR reducing system RseC family protein [Deltaproteobacteria bacterium]